jgi:hypothetical protein
MTDEEELKAQNRTEEMAFSSTLQREYEREDGRYRMGSQARDWFILVVIGILQFAWMLVVFLIEPGIR